MERFLLSPAVIARDDGGKIVMTDDESQCRVLLRRLSIAHNLPVMSLLEDTLSKLGPGLMVRMVRIQVLAANRSSLSAHAVR